MKKKKYDAVKEMRTIREKLSEKYWKQPEVLKEELAEVRKKYNFKENLPVSN